MTPSDPDVSELEHEIRHNPRAFAVRFVGMVDDVAEIKDAVKDTQSLVRRVAGFTATVMVGVIVDLGLRLQEAATQPDAPDAAQSAAVLLERLLG